ncbi:MAG: hypothetical protein R2932_02080 [Caldilineaceae bacterium]
MSNKHWFASAGLIYVVAWLVGLLIEFDTPQASASLSELTAYFQSHQQTHLLQAYLIAGIAGIALLIFTAALVMFLQERTNTSSAFVYTILGSGIAAATVSLVQAGLQEALISQPILAAQGESLRLLLVMIGSLDTFKLLALALLSGLTSVLVLRARLWPQWLGWMGILLTGTLVLGGLNFIVNNIVFLTVLFVSLPLLLLWVGSVSVVILLNREASPLSL